MLSYWDDDGGIGSADLDLDSSSTAYDEDAAARRRRQRLERRRRNRGHGGSRYHRGGVAEGDYVFEDLSPNTEYEVKIRAKNRFGWSQDEGEFVFTTSDRGEKIISQGNVSDFLLFLLHQLLLDYFLKDY